MAPKRRSFAFVDPALTWMVERGLVPENQRISSEMPMIRPPLMQASSKATSALTPTTSSDMGSSTLMVTRSKASSSRPTSPSPKPYTTPSHSAMSSSGWSSSVKVLPSLSSCAAATSTSSSMASGISMATGASTKEDEKTAVPKAKGKSQSKTREDKAPPIYNKTRGSKRLAIEIAGDTDLREQAMASYLKDVKSAGDTSEYNLLTWTELHHAWWKHIPNGDHVPPFPLTPDKVSAVGCLLKAAGYRSGYNYIGAAKDEHLQQGHPWTDILARAHRRFSLSVQRGIGPPQQSEPLSFPKLMDLDFSVPPLVDQGPVNTKAVVIMFTFWFIRDLEGCMAKVPDLTLNHHTRVVTWRLSASKTDPGALGCERQWGCLCPMVGCPFCAACEHMEILKNLFGEATSSKNFPLFPNACGEVVSEAAMQALVEKLAKDTGEQIHLASGVLRIGRHTWRSTAAVYFSGPPLNLELFKVQLLARWGSPVILHYARLAPLQGLTAQIKDLNSVGSLGKIVSQLRSKVKAIRDAVPAMDEYTQQLVELEVKMANLIESKVSAKPPELPVVRNEKTGCHHHIIDTDGPPATWITKCKFEFAFVPHVRLAAPPDDWRLLCGICFRGLRAHFKLMEALPE